MAEAKRPAARKSAQRRESVQRAMAKPRPRKKSSQRSPAPTQPTPDVQVRTSERKDFKRCVWRWHHVWREGLERRGATVNALWFGTGVHHALAKWRSKPGVARGLHPADAWAVWCKDEYRTMRIENDFQEPEYIDAKMLGRLMLEGYLEEYGTDEWMHMIAVETPFQIMVPRGDGTWFEYDGTFDGVFRDLRNDELFILEIKTAKQIRTRHLSLDDQAGSYLWVATEILRDKAVLKPKEELSGIMYDFLRKQKPDARPVNALGQRLNQDGSVSKKQPLPNYHREHVWRNARGRVVQAQKVIAEERAMAAYRSGDLPLIKNPTIDCSWDCSLFEMCELHEEGGDWQEFRDTMFKRRDPYADHRKSSGGAEQ